jgi:hypothetical protein
MNWLEGGGRADKPGQQIGDAHSRVQAQSHEIRGQLRVFGHDPHVPLQAQGEADTDRRASWLGLCDLTARVLVHALDLLGIGVPDRM